MRSMSRFAALLCAGLLLLPVGALAAEGGVTRSVAVSATGTVNAKPDIAHISTGVVSEGETARQALDENTAAMSKVVAELKAKGVEPKDIQTTDFSVHPRYKHEKEGAPPVIVGYRVVNSVRITVRKIKTLGVILDKVVTLGSNQIGGIESLQDEARRRAMQKALAKAKLYAEAAGAKVGQVLTITEDLIQQPPRPVFARAAMEAKAADVPIEAGEHMVQAKVHVTWELD
jgi:uncharacterized protein YggE